MKLISGIFFCIVVLNKGISLAQGEQSSLSDSIQLYSKLGMMGRVMTFTEMLAEQNRILHGDSSAQYGSSLNRLGLAHFNIGDFRKAQEILSRGLAINLRKLGPNHLEVAVSYHYLGAASANLGEFDKAETCHRNALEIRKKNHPEGHPLIAGSLHNLGVVSFYRDEFAQAERYFLEAITIRTRFLGAQHPDVATSFTGLAGVYLQLRDLRKAEIYYSKALQIKTNVYGKDHPVLQPIWNGLGLIYMNLNEYPKAEKALLEILRIQEKSQMNESPDIAIGLFNLGDVYQELGDYAKAESYFQRALSINKKAYGDEHPDVTRCLVNLGAIYTDTRNFPLAKQYLTQAIEAIQKSKGNQSDITVPLNNLGSIHAINGSFAKAEALYMESLGILTRFFGDMHPSLTTPLSALGDICLQRAHYEEAQAYYQRSYEIRKKKLGKFHPGLGASLRELTKLSFEKKETQKGLLHLASFQQQCYNQTMHTFPFLSDFEKLKFYEKVKPFFEEAVGMLFHYAQNLPQTPDNLYDQQLFTKGILLSASQKFKNQLRNTTDSVTRKKFELWEKIGNRIAQIYRSSDSAEVAELKKLTKEVEDVEKELARNSTVFAQLGDWRCYSWKEVQAKLKPGEAAIEMVRFQTFGLLKTVKDSLSGKPVKFKVKGVTDSICYTALIVEPGMTHPKMVTFPEGAQMEAAWINQYKFSIQNRIQDLNSYDRFWKKIQDALGKGTRRIYFSPDGIYHNINPGTLLNPKTEKYLIEEQDIIILTNTRDLVQNNTGEPNAPYACLAGYPDYNSNAAQRKNNVWAKPKDQFGWYSLNRNRGDLYTELPGTKQEVASIASLLVVKGWSVDSLIGERALEENLKAIQRPRVLHIATHGFFNTDTLSSINPLINSGLLLAGANRSLEGEKDEMLDDGILTAYEAMNLNLDNTDLVVLSACETGLGEIKNGEGVYGLQRAFKVAGARSIIMSLWKVDDEATQELMVGFYKHWLKAVGSASGGQTAANLKRTAFLAAQKELKAKYPNPYFWGAFVMVGE